MNFIVEENRTCQTESPHGGLKTKRHNLYVVKSFLGGCKCFHTIRPEKIERQMAVGWFHRTL